MQKDLRPQLIHVVLIFALPTLTFLAVLISCQTVPSVKRSDALWNIISTQCLPNESQTGKPDPCAEVARDAAVKVSTDSKDAKKSKDGHGYVVLKDRNGDLQYLLMPTDKITGVESLELLDPHYPNYFALAWRERTWMSKKRGKPIADDVISLTVNSQLARSQNQLHIHISCIRPDVAEQLKKNLTALSLTEWRDFPGGINGHHYTAHLIRGVDLSDKNPFSLVASDLGDAKAHMGDFGIAIVPLNGGEEFVVLADRAGSTPGDRGAAEEIQDHGCPQLQSH